MCYIYTLHASNDPECRPRYVGFTRFVPKRKKAHLSGKEPARKGDWAREVIRSGGKIVFKVVHVFFSDDTHERGVIEAEWISRYREEFPDLLNDKGGGGGIANCSPERSRNISQAQKRRYQNPEAIEKNRQAILKYFEAPEAREKSRQAAFRRYSKSSEIEKMKAAQKKRYSRPEEIERNRRAILLASAKNDLLNPSPVNRDKQRLRCLKCKAKKDAEQKGIAFDEVSWLADYQILLASVRAEALQFVLDTI